MDASPSAIPFRASAICACAKSSRTPRVRSSGGRFIPPRTSIRAPFRIGRRLRSFRSMRRRIRQRANNEYPLRARACSGTTFEAVPPVTTVACTVIPRRGSFIFISRAICSASSCTAFTPCSGSIPACAARPVTIISAVPTPLRAVLRRPSRAERRLEHQHRVAAPRFALDFAAANVALPISSSEVHKKTRRLRGRMPAARSASTAKSASTSPAFMSNVPGPHKRVRAPRETASSRACPADRPYRDGPSTRICPARLAARRAKFPRARDRRACAAAGCAPSRRGCAIRRATMRPIAVHRGLVVARRFASHELARAAAPFPFRGFSSRAATLASARGFWFMASRYHARVSSVPSLCTRRDSAGSYRHASRGFPCPQFVRFV